MYACGSGQPEPVFLTLLRRPGIDSQPGGPVRHFYSICRTGSPGGIDSSESIPGLLRRLQIRVLFYPNLRLDFIIFFMLQRVVYVLMYRIYSTLYQPIYIVQCTYLLNLVQNNYVNIHSTVSVYTLNTVQ